MHQCRYCKDDASDNVLFHYAVNHWAHFKCWIKRHGIEEWRKLNKYQRASFPAMLIGESGATWNEIEPLMNLNR